MATVWLTYNGAGLVSANGYGLGRPNDPYNPLDLPPKTMRLLFEDGVTPTVSYGTITQVSSSPNVWDFHHEGNMWGSALERQSQLLEVLGANTTGVTYMGYLFDQCTSLTSVALFDTRSATVGVTWMFNQCYSLVDVPLFDLSNVTDTSVMFAFCTSLVEVPVFSTGSVTDMTRMFDGCTSLKHVPLLNTSSCGYTSRMFQNCVNVESGSYDLYRQALTQAVPVAEHFNMFKNCGINTTTGSAELAQIPSDWK